MKILLLNLLMSVATQATEMNGSEDYSWILKELNAQATEMMVESPIENKVKIFDATGNLIKEILKADYEENQMKNSEYRLIAQSTFMFNYLGDSYLLLDK